MASHDSPPGNHSSYTGHQSATDGPRNTQHEAEDDEATSATRIVHRSIMPLMLTLVPLIVFVATAAAQSGGTGSAFCQTQMAETIKNIFTLIQFGGPLIGGVLALGATVTIPFVRRSDRKKEMKTIRNQGILWGVIVAPLGTVIIQFILTNVVAGGASCTF